MHCFLKLCDNLGTPTFEVKRASDKQAGRDLNPVDLTGAVTSPLMFVVGSFLSVYMYTHILLEIYLGKNKCG